MPTLDLEVWLGSIHVGQLRQALDYRTYFEFNQAYLELARRPVLGQWFEDRLGPAAFSGPHGSLPTFFDNLLPSQQLQRLIRLQHDLENPTDAELLACVGEDLPGSTIVRDPRRSAPVGFEDSPAIEDEESEGHQLRLHFSLAGLQLKFSLVKDGRLLTLPARSAVGRVIAKIPTMHGAPSIIENEFAVMQWARAAGFDVPPCEIRDAEDLSGVPARAHGRKILVVERFDREAGRRVHQEDLAQVLGIDSSEAVSPTGSLSYDDVCRVIDRVLGREGAREFVRRLALIVASGNEDAHLKNWALLYPDGITPVWAPLYDQVAIIAWSNGSEGLTLGLGGVRDWVLLDKSALERFAVVAGLQRGETTEIFAATVERLRKTWLDAEVAASLDPVHAVALRNHWTRVPLLACHGPLDR